MMTDEDLPQEEMMHISKDLYYELLNLGILDESGVRDSNAGKSNYATKLIQPWTVFLAYPELTYWDHDNIKRTLRIKDEGGMTAIEARILDYKKMIHNCQERIRQLELQAD